LPKKIVRKKKNRKKNPSKSPKSSRSLVVPIIKFYTKKMEKLFNINMFVKSFKFSESDIEINVDMKKIETITNIKDFFSMAGLNFETEKAR
jgi:hypothetical protein